ncbi:MAG: cysteine desulfurase [Lachnospiraceae bacterium]|nr:cysteine desulfurase [Lachnospiraceae bacterium]
MSNKIYLDNAATTELLPEVSYAMEHYFIKKYGNASTTYELGAEAKNAIEQARKEIALTIDAKPSEIFFTSGGSESDNWAIKSIAGDRKHIGKHILTSKIEHHAVLHSCEYLESLDYKVTYLDVDENGIVDLEQMKSVIQKGKDSFQIKDNVTLISVMYANNEIGTLEPIEEIGRIARKNHIFFHTDAVQAVGQIPISVRKLPIDMLSASAHKFHGPKGVGFLYVREGLSIPSFIHGGAQEKGKRAGTENVAGIVGMAKALSISSKEMSRKRRELSTLRNYFVKRVLKEIPQVFYNGHPSKRLPGNISFSIKNVNATALLVLLEEEGIFASAGSACNTGITSISHVIQAIDVPKEYAYGTIRFSMGRETTKKDIDKTISVLKHSVEVLRRVEDV